MWRPDDWKTEFDCSVCDVEPEGCPGCGSNAYEAGADAMLEALWRMAKESPTGTFTFDTDTINVYADEGKE